MVSAGYFINSGYKNPSHTTIKAPPIRVEIEQMPEGSYGQLLKQPDSRFHRCYSNEDLQLHLLRKEQPRQFGKYHGTDKKHGRQKKITAKTPGLKNLVRS